MKKRKQQHELRCVPIDLICPPQFFQLKHNNPPIIRSSSKHPQNYEAVKPKFDLTKTNTDWSYQPQLAHLSKTFYERKALISQPKVLPIKNRIGKSPYIRNTKQFLKVLELMKPVKGPSGSVLCQIKKHNDSNQRNAENVIMNGTDNFTKKMAKFKARLGLNEDVKLFIMNSQDLHIREALKKYGWVQNNDLSSIFYNLKWVYNDNLHNYQNMQQSQFYNHFKNNQELTNKNNLRKNIKNSAKINRPNIPVTYDLQINEELIDFSAQFMFYQVLKVLNKIKDSLQNNDIQMYKKYQQNSNYRLNHKKIKIKPIKQYAPTQKQIRKLLLTNYQLPNAQFFHDIYVFCGYVAARITKLKNIRYSIFYNNRQKWAMNKYETLDRVRQYFDTLHINCTIKCLSKFTKIELLKMHDHLKQYWIGSMGDHNLWIVKPAGVSRGSGISIQSNYLKISSIRYGKIVQKYIQRPKVLPCGRKFDIRQWVLVKSFTPLQAYIFQHSYCRFTSQKYNIDNINNLQIHLTNYTQNKDIFVDKGESVMSQEELRDILGEHQWELLRNKIKIQIVKTLNCCSSSISEGRGCFQVYGFDILIDSELKPWILEVNMSPACEKRSLFLQNYLSKMAEGIVMFIQNIEPKGWQNLNNIITQLQTNSFFQQNVQKVIAIQNFFRKSQLKNKQIITNDN